MKLLHELRYDLPAGIVVFFVAVPLCLGIALASGAPLMAGLVAGVVGGVVVGALSRSALGVSGPAAGLAVIVLEAIDVLGGFEAFLTAVVLAGFMQIALGYARAGVLAYFFPSAVIKGMLSGIGLIIILKQLPHALGYDASPEGEVSFTQSTGGTTFSSLADMFSYIDPRAALLAAVALAVLIGWERWLAPRGRWWRLVQGPLVVVAGGIVYQVLASRYAPDWALAPEHLVGVPVAEGVRALAASLATPDWSVLDNVAIYTTAVTLAVVASLETLLCVEATDRLDPRKRVTPTDRELVAQGVGNVVSGLAGGLPITQVIVRSSANIQSGARTRLATIVHGVLLALFVVALPELLNLIPLAVLASILLVVGYKLATPAVFRAMLRQGPEQAVPFGVTVAAVVLTDLLSGIALGMVVSLVFILHRNYLNSHFLHIEESDERDGRHLVVMRLAEEVTFLNKGAIRQQLSALPAQCRVVIDASASVSVDHDVREIIEDFRDTAAGRGISVEVRGLPPSPADGTPARA